MKNEESEKKIENKHIFHITFNGEMEFVCFRPRILLLTTKHENKRNEKYLGLDFRHVGCYLGFVQMLSETTRCVYKFSYYLNYLQIHF